MLGIAGLRKALRVFFLYTVVPIICAGGPVVWFSGAKWWSHLTTSLSSRSSAAAVETYPGNPPAPLSAVNVATLPALPAEVPASAAPALPQQNPKSPDGEPIVELAEAFRFDISPRWITETWPRVSAALGHLRLQGYRVPLVTGGAEDDLAGALTYYFDAWQQAQQITFVGTTGDVRKLIQMLTTKFGFARRLTNDPSQFVYEARGSGGQSRGTLWIRHMPVLKASHPRERYEVNLTLERPEEKQKSG